MSRGGYPTRGIIAQGRDGDVKTATSATIIGLGVWRQWRLHLLRIGTRESTAVLYLDVGGTMEEQIRINWDSTPAETAMVFELTTLRAGIGFSSAGAKATLLVDELQVSENPIPSRHVDNG